MAQRPDVVARVRGAAIGSMSGAVGIAAHGAAATPAHAAPSQTELVFLLGACALVGTAVASLDVLTRSRVALLATIAAGQVVAHTTLATVGTHAADHAAHVSTLSTPMIAAHAVAIVVTAVLVRGVERAATAGLAAVRRIVAAVLSALPAHAPLWIATPSSRPGVRREQLTGATAGTRAPPVLV